jgi:hypothetical protein
MNRFARFLVLLVCACVFSACGSSKSKAGDKPRLSIDRRQAELYMLSSFGGVSGSEMIQQFYRDEEIRTQNLITECMINAGFPYVPIIPPIEQGPPKNSLEFAQQYGLMKREPGGPPADPNMEYIKTLSPDGSVKYSAALSGDQPGCSLLAAAQKNAVNNVTDKYTERAMDRLNRVLSDPRMQSIEKNWRDCMMGKGYRVEHPSELDDLVDKKYQTANTENQAEQVFRYEIDIAVANVNCKEPHKAEEEALWNVATDEIVEKYGNQIIEELMAL